MDHDSAATTRARLHRILDAVSDLPEQDRGPALDLLCAGRPDLADAARRALSTDGQARLEQELSRRLGAGHAAPAELAPAAPPGQTIGPYRLLERLGEGAFGEVFVAEQSAPVRRRVAVKLLKPGMGSREVIARFEAERQALALMEHPNIAKVFDAGTTALGLPYFVMELVRGQPITAYCNEQRLSLRERLALLLPVCAAVQHAHQRGIIHRDLKPGNVLVTVLDGKAVPKVIDFGIAKAVGPGLGGATIYTQFRQFVGTPAYMSPEQMSLSAVDVDTRSDVYSLGAMMYELVSGSTPFDADTLMRAGLDELRRVVRESDPPKPSSRLSTLDGALLSALAQQHRTTPQRIGRLVAGEVDWIVLRAIEKERGRRYQTPLELAADIECFLAGRAVSAGPPGGLYRARKFLRRHRVPAAMTAIALAGLATAAIGTGLGLQREAAARREAEKSARVTQAALRLMPVVLGEGDPRASGGPKDVTIGQAADKLLATIDRGRDELGRPIEAEVLIEVRLGVAGLYFGVGRYADGRTQAARALQDAEKVYPPDSIALARALAWNVTAAWFGGDRVAGEAKAKQALDIIARRGEEGTPLHADLLAGLGLMYHGQGRALESLQNALQRAALLESMQPPALDGLGVALGDAALNSLPLGRAAAALPLAERAVRVKIQAHGPDGWQLSRVHAVHANVLRVLGRIEDAEREISRSLQLADQHLGPDHPYPMFERQTRAFILVAAGKLDEATSQLEQLRSLHRAQGNRMPRPEHMVIDAMIARRRGDHAKTLAIFQMAAAAAFSGPTPAMQRDDPSVGSAFAEWCGALVDTGDPAQGVSQLEPIMEGIRARLARTGDDTPDSTILRPMASELLRAYLAIGDEPNRAKADTLRARFPGLVPAQGFAPASGG